MTQKEEDILSTMEGNAWLRPMDFGGTDASQHATIATRMVSKGWVDRESRSGARAYVYRITDKGLNALWNHRSLMAALRSA
jgi:hypothetical protein